MNVKLRRGQRCVHSAKSRRKLIDFILFVGENVFVNVFVILKEVFDTRLKYNLWRVVLKLLYFIFQQ